MQLNQQLTNEQLQQHCEHMILTFVGRYDEYHTQALARAQTKWYLVEKCTTI